MASLLPLRMLDLNQNPPTQTHGPIHCDKGDKGRLLSCPTYVIPGINIARALERTWVFVGRKRNVAMSTAALTELSLETAFGLEAFDARMRAFATTFDLWPLAERQSAGFPLTSHNLGKTFLFDCSPLGLTSLAFTLPIADSGISTS